VRLSAYFCSLLYDPLLTGDGNVILNFKVCFRKRTQEETFSVEASTCEKKKNIMDDLECSSE